MNAQTKAAQEQTSGFTIPSQLAEFPSAPRKGVLLTLEQEQSFGFTMLNYTLGQIEAIACDVEIVEAMISDIESAFTKSNKADKSVALVNVDGLWYRNGSVDDDSFAAIAQDQIMAIRRALSAFCAGNHAVRDLFYLNAISDLRGALTKLVPYDVILSKATTTFREHYSTINSACSDLVTFVSTEMLIPKPASNQVCSEFLLSNKLPAVCLSANRYVQSLMPTSVKREFREGIVTRQNRIAKLAMTTGVPVAELIKSWSAFNIVAKRIDRMAGTFAQMNAGLVEKTASQYHFANDFDQVRSAAYQGLTRAMSLYAPERGLKFSTYATNWIKQIILRDLIQQDIVRLPEGSHAMLTRARAVYADAPNASDEYVCKLANITARELKSLRPYLLGNSAMSMDSTGSDEEGSGLHTLIADENNDFAKTVEEDSTSEYMNKVLASALTEKEQFVLRHRMGLGHAKFMTNPELAEVLNTSPQNVNRIEKAAQVKLSNIPEIQAIWSDMH